jgi:hypothetical protein
VISDFPAPDAIAGFAAVFRQFYADERGGFKVASGILMRAALDAYDTPQVLAVPVIDANPAYRDWVLASTRDDDGDADTSSSS